MRGTRVQGRGLAATGRTLALLAGLMLAACALPLTGAVAAPPDGGAVFHRVHSRAHLRAFWTPRRIRAAKPLSVLEYRSDGRLLTAAGDSTPAAAAPTAQGTDTGDSTLFPNRANGLVLFFYGSTEYQCSGSVVNSPAGNVVLTAGHCVIDPGPGTTATDIVFIPGYRDGAEPYGEWPATSFVTTPEWKNTASTGNPNDSDEAGDMAMLRLGNRPSDNASIQSVVGSVGIAFNQARNQTYMEYGYPAAFPYDGSRLYEHTSGLSYNDSSFTPATMGISSDFTGGSSGGPWLVGSPPQAMSINVYNYNTLPNVMFGPYFGSIAQNLYDSATGANQPPASATTPSSAFRLVVLSRNRSRGVVVLGAKVPGAGLVVLRGAGLRTLRKTASGRQTVALAVRARGSALADLRGAGHLRVHVGVTYRPTDGSANSKGRDLFLVRR